MTAAQKRRFQAARRAEVAAGKAQVGNSPKRPSVAAHAAVVFVAALAVRLIYAAQVSNCPLYQTPTMDAGYYYALARQFANGHWSHPLGMPYWQPPLFSMALAIWMRIVGTAVPSVKIGGLILGSVNCVLTMLLGRRVFGRTVGLVAGIAAALYGPLVYFDGELLTPTLQIFLNLSAILVLMKAMGRDCKSRPITGLLATTGLLFGLSIVTRPDVALFVVVASIWAALALRSEGTGKAAAAVGLLIACAAIPAIPITIRNAVAGKDPALISTNGGINFYIGNNADYDRTVEIRPGPEWDALQRMPLKDNPRASSSQQSRWFYRKGLDFIAHQPVRWAGVTLKKLVVYLSAIEGRRDQDLYFYRGYSFLYSALLFKTRWFAFPLGLVLPLAVFGLIRRLSVRAGFEIPPERKGELRLLIWYLAAMLVVTVAFFPCARYRVTVVPALLMFATSGALELWRIHRDREWRAAIMPLAVALFALLLSNANICRVDARSDLIEAEAHYAVAQTLSRNREFAEAAEECAKALELNPRLGAARLNYSRVLSAQGKDSEAKRQLEMCLKQNPRYAAAHMAMGELLAKKGDKAGARSHFQQALTLDAGYRDRLMDFAKDAYAHRVFATAECAMRAIVAVRPDDAEAQSGLGMVLLAQGKPSAAIPYLDTACSLAPSLAGNYVTLGVAYHRAGRATEARKTFDIAIGMGPADQVRASIQQLLGEK
jgi:tetratricopeptide (TPR) repeat protein